LEQAFRFHPPAIDWLPLLPMIVVVATGVLALIIEMLRPKQNNNAIVVTSLIGLAAAGLLAAAQIGWPDVETVAGMVLRDRFALVIQLLMVLGSFVVILFSEGYLREKRIPFGEFYPLLLWSTFGGMLMASTTNMLVIFLGLEVMSIAIYVMVGMGRLEERSEEGALKYFLLGAFATGFLLYGMALIYGATGSLFLEAISAAWVANPPGAQSLLLFGIGLVLIGLMFKASFVPFHQWTPDVYQGAPTNVTSYLAAGSKVAAIAALWRVLDASLVMREYWIPALMVVAVLTMTVGNFVALAQRDVKRVLAYSSIAHAGYILVGILAYAQRPDLIGFGTVAFYLLSYSLMTIGAFAVISLAAKGGREETTFEDLHGMWRRSPLAAGSLIVFVASLIGIPPSAGFIAKFLIFSDALQTGLTWLAIVLAVNSIVSVYYYLAIARAAFVSDEERVAERQAVLHPGLATACVVCLAGIVGLMVFFAPVNRFLVGPEADPAPVIVVSRSAP
jgi:NADH-quinone oxidoreductase subunit N